MYIYNESNNMYNIEIHSFLHLHCTLKSLRNNLKNFKVIDSKSILEYLITINPKFIINYLLYIIKDTLVHIIQLFKI